MHTSRGRGMRAAARASAFFSEHGRRAKREPENMVYWYCRLCYYCITKSASQTNRHENICEGCSPGPVSYTHLGSQAASAPSGGGDERAVLSLPAERRACISKWFPHHDLWLSLIHILISCAKRFKAAAVRPRFPLLKKEENRYAEGTAYFCGGG